VSDELAAAVRSLETSRAALADAFAATRLPPGRVADDAPPLDGLWNMLCASLEKAIHHHGWSGRLRSSLELVRLSVQDAVRTQPWTAVAVAGLSGAVAVWIVATRRRLVVSAARWWWRTAGAAILFSTAFNFYEQYTAAKDRPGAPQDGPDEEGPRQED
jgi:hypothetical protein